MSSLVLFAYPSHSPIEELATKSLNFTMPNIVASCHKLLEAEVLRRSSQVVSVVGDRAYIFGGELQPREPRDNDVYSVSLNTGKLKACDEPTLLLK